ncbi:hypothetical protein [Geotalea uraniireducens]|uniref:hypothetical protein n=1 Tax=Geotalea uraniireducens TaxID=351604 RepID=UPI00059B5DDE|nr:hypothetical protein [Geotalea uraniireducens]
MHHIVIALFVMLFASPAIAGSDKFSVKDASKNKVFTVQDDGTFIAPGLKYDPITKRLGVGTQAPVSALHLVEELGNPDRGLTINQYGDGGPAGVVNIKRSRNLSMTLRHLPVEFSVANFS